MKVSVFTGPYFSERDHTMYGVRIPLAFWKIIAFIHDDTGELCATGYEMNQEQCLQLEEEFVFGAFTSPQLATATQVSIRSIETRSGISFDRLAVVDPLIGTDETLGDEPRQALNILEDVCFIRWHTSAPCKRGHRSDPVGWTGSRRRVGGAKDGTTYREGAYSGHSFAQEPERAHAGHEPGAAPQNRVV